MNHKHTDMKEITHICTVGNKWKIFFCSTRRPLNPLRKSSEHTRNRRLVEVQRNSELYVEKKYRWFLPGICLLTDFHYIPLQFKDAKIMYTGKLTSGHVVNSVAVLTTLIPKPGNGPNPILTTYFPQVRRHCTLLCTSQPSKWATFPATTDILDSRQVRSTDSVVGFRRRKG
jgi:hypothetical protein